MKIMVCFDGTNAAQRALEYAQKRVGEQKGELWVVQSLQAQNGTAHIYAEEIEAAQKSLEAVKSSLASKKISFQTYLLQRGLAAGEDLVLFAKENAVDEIVIGIRKRSRMEKLLLGSAAQYIILNAGRPVVAV